MKVKAEILLSPTEHRILTLKQEINARCGNCNHYRTSMCTNTKVDNVRMVRIFPLKNAKPCNKWKADYTVRAIDEEYIMLKMGN